MSILFQLGANTRKQSWGETWFKIQKQGLLRAISQLGWRILTFSCVFVSQISLWNTCLRWPVGWGWCVYCRLAGRQRSAAVAWPEGWQWLHNSLQQRQQGLCPALPPPARSQELAKNPCPRWTPALGKAGSRYLAGLEVGDKSKEKTSSRVMAVGDKQPLTCELLLEGNHIFPCPVVFACVSHYFYLKIILVQWIIDVRSHAFLQELLS